MFRFFKNKFCRSCDGSTAIEYALIGTGIALVIIASVTLLGTNVSAFYTNVAAAFS